MRTYPFKFHIPFVGTEGRPPILEIIETMEFLGEYVTSNIAGLPTYRGIESDLAVYESSKKETVIAEENIRAGSALNLHHVNNILVARKASNIDRNLYCNAVALSSNVAGQKIEIISNTGYIPVAVLPPVLADPNTPIWLSSIPGSFSSVPSTGEIVQLCGYMIARSSMYFQYNNPVLTS